MPHWTNLELYRLAVMYERDQHSREELRKAFPLHTVDNTMARASVLGLKRYHYRQQKLRWLKIAHLHFARREVELRA